MYRVTIEMIGGNGKYGFDYFDQMDFDTYSTAYNAMRRWRSKIKARHMARVTLYMKNTKEIDFETSVFKPTINSAGKITGAEYNKKDRGISLMYVDWTEVISVTRDTRRDDE